MYPSKDWVHSQIPDIVKNGVECLGDDTVDIDELDAEAFVQAYIHIVAGSCISLGRFILGEKYSIFVTCYLDFYILNLTWRHLIILEIVHSLKAI